MRYRNRISSLACLLLAAGFFSLSASAANHDESDNQEVLADVYIVQAAAGQHEKFEEGIRKHLAFRNSKDDPREWHVYSPVLGKNLDYYIIRSCCTTWADMDSYRNWSQEAGVSADFEKNVAPYTADQYSHHISAIDTRNSRWPDDVGDPAYVGVTRYYPKQGMYGSINRSLSEFMEYIDKGEWDRPHSVSWTVGGKPMMSIANPFDSFADMKEPSPSFFEMVAEQVGGPDEAEKRFKAWADNFHGSSYTVYAHRPDLGGSTDE